MADERKTLALPLYEANAYEAALDVALDLLHRDLDAEPRATLVRLRDRIADARIATWGRR